MSKTKTFLLEELAGPRGNTSVTLLCDKGCEIVLRNCDLRTFTLGKVQNGSVEMHLRAGPGMCACSRHRKQIGPQRS